MAEYPADQKTDVVQLPPALELPAVRLLVIDGPDRGKEAPIRDGRARIGTAPGNDLRLSDSTVSRMHCLLDISSDRIRVLDRDSTNGTFIQGLRIRDADLHGEGDIRLGNTTVRLQLGGQPQILQLSTGDHLGPLVGSSVAMRRIYALLERVAPSDATVLIEGETGTGKELVAHTLHDLSPRGSGPYVTVDCGAIAPNLIESELFGHLRGAFTGAISDRIGAIEAAHGGTVFFDEIGELPFELQPKLLRTLEAREVRPVGSHAPRRVDVRVLAATNRSLTRSVNHGLFREDLYYRLAVVEIELPPLRGRGEDLPALIAHFYHLATGQQAPPPTELIAAAASRSWPGNVRELRNFVERSVLLGGARPTPLPHDAPTAARPVAAMVEVNEQLPLKAARAAWVERFERIYSSLLLERAGGNVTHAARLAGLSRRSLQRMMARLGLRGHGNPRT